MIVSVEVAKFHYYGPLSTDEFYWLMNAIQTINLTLWKGHPPGLVKLQQVNWNRCPVFPENCTVETLFSFGFMNGMYNEIDFNDFDFGEAVDLD